MHVTNYPRLTMHTPKTQKRHLKLLEQDINSLETVVQGVVFLVISYCEKYQALLHWLM